VLSCTLLVLDRTQIVVLWLSLRRDEANVEIVLVVLRLG
jgi:hypothetical protein